MQKVQIIGKIGGATQEQLDMFTQAETKLKARGYDVFNPLKLDRPTPYLNLLECLRHMIDKRPILVVLPSHQDSAGSEIELKIAKKLNLPIYKNMIPKQIKRFTEPTSTHIAIFEEVYRICEKHIGKMDRTEFESTARYTDLVFFRGAVSYAMFHIFGLSCSEIGCLLNRDRTAVFHYVNLSIPSILAVNYPAEQAMQIKKIMLDCENLKIQLDEV